MPYDDEPGAYWLALGPDGGSPPNGVRPGGLEASAFPGDYFRGGRPNRAEVTAYFEPHAVGA